MNKNLLIILLISVVVLQACGATRGTSSKGGRSIETGLASWYGPNFHGKTTANGEKYDMNALTAAHKTLPFNTVVRVESQDNGKSVVVRINDRGPFIAGRVIDLSRKAADRIDMIGTGTASVRLYLIEDGDRPVTAQNASSSETFTVQLASFESEQAARKKSREIKGSRVEKVQIRANTFYRVYYGTFRSPNDARKAQRRLNNQGHNGFVKQIEN